MTSDPAARTLPEYENNPLIAALGPPRSPSRSLALLQRSPRIGEADRALPHFLRRHCLMRLNDFVHPRACQVQLAETIDMLVREGYKGRDPSTGAHLAAILAAASDRPDAQQRTSSPGGVLPMSSGRVLIGHPGMGKTTTLKIIVDSYPSVVSQATRDAVFKQVPILMLEAPQDGSRKAFCLDIVRQIAARVGQEEVYERLYCGPRVTVESLLHAVQSLVQIHAVGLILVDEIQHLLQGRESPALLMNFLTKLMNVAGVPVVVVGVAGTEAVVRGFRVARRGAGLPKWARLGRGPEWDRLVGKLWTYQWTRSPTGMTEEIRAVLYDETQGIIDVLVKLFVVVQYRAIWMGETKKDLDEQITPELIRRTAREDFHLIARPIEALRKNRPDHLIDFSDLGSLHDHVNGMLVGPEMDPNGFLEAREAERRAVREAAALELVRDWRSILTAALETRKLGPEAIDAVLAEVARRHPSGDASEGDVLARMATMLAVLNGEGEAGRPRRAARDEPAGEVSSGGAGVATRRSGRRAVASRPPSTAGSTGTASTRPSQSSLPPDDPQDLRTIGVLALKEKRTVHEVLRERGICAPLSSVIGHS